MADAIATREAYGKALARVGETHPEIVVLDADLSKSTMTVHFAKKFPERFFQMGIAESNMVCTAAGLATCGKKPFVSSFAIFASRAWEQIRNTVARGELPVAFCLSHTGLSVGEDGASAQACEDVAIMRAIPNMHVVVPSDGPETEQTIEFIANNIHNLHGPIYVRLSRNKLPIFHDANYKFRYRKAEIIREGKEITYIACGSMVATAIKASDALKAENIIAGVVNMSTIKPIDSEAIIAAAKKTKRIITLEEHTILGGLGDAVASVLCENYPVPMKKIGVEDIFGESGTADQLLAKYGLDLNSVLDKTKKFLKNSATS